MTERMTQHELREQVIRQLPDLIAEFEARNGPIETLQIIKGRQLAESASRRISCPERREVLGPPVTAPKPKGRHGGYRGPRGPRPQNVAIMRELVPLKLSIPELIKRSGLSRPTVTMLRKQILEEIEQARIENLDAVRRVHRFRRAFRMKQSYSRKTQGGEYTWQGSAQL